MSVGGIITEIIKINNEKAWINTRERKTNEECGVFSTLRSKLCSEAV